MQMESWLLDDDGIELILQVTSITILICVEDESWPGYINEDKLMVLRELVCSCA